MCAAKRPARGFAFTGRFPVGCGPDMSGPYREANFYASGSLSTVISTKFRLMKLSAPESRV